MNVLAKNCLTVGSTPLAIALLDCEELFHIGPPAHPSERLFIKKRFIGAKRVLRVQSQKDASSVTVVCCEFGNYTTCLE